MADVAGIRDFQRVAQGGTDKAESMATDVHIAERLGDLRHMASNAVAARTVSFVMRMLRDCRRVGASR